MHSVRKLYNNTIHQNKRNCCIVPRVKWDHSIDFKTFKCINLHQKGQLCVNQGLPFWSEENWKPG